MTTDPNSGDLYDEAIWRLKQNYDNWKMQLDYAVGHPCDLAIDFDCLRERYELVRPFVHRAIAGALGAMAKVGFDPAMRAALGASVSCLVVTASWPGQACSAGISARLLLLAAPLEDGPEDPTEALAAEIRRTLFPADPYQRAEREIVRLEWVLRQAELWPGEPPPGPLEVRGAFGCENMSLAQWLAWVLLPRLGEISATRGEFPRSSALAIHAAREFSGLPGEGEIHEVLRAIDELCGGQA